MKCVNNVVQHVLEVTAQLKKKICMPSGGCTCGVLSHHWAKTELFPTGNTHLKKSLLKYILPPAGDNTALLSAVKLRKDSLSGLSYC